MTEIIGLLKIRVCKGTNLVAKDIVKKASDPYVLIATGNQKVKTNFVKNTLNPEWNQDLTITIKDPNAPINLYVYDRDRFNRDDKMGNAEIDIGPYLQSHKKDFEDLPFGTKVDRIQPNQKNCLADESCIIWDEGGKLYQEMCIKLRDVPHGDVYIRLDWMDANPFK